MAQQDAINWAKQALRHTKYTLVIGASNIDANVERTGGHSSYMIARMRGVPVNWQKGNWMDFGLGAKILLDNNGDHWDHSLPAIPPPTPMNRARIQTMCQRAQNHRAGNCQENAAVAFEYLVQNAQNVGKVSYMHVPNHCFVVLNHDDDVTDSASLGDDAVLCDPWAGYVCTQAQLQNANGGNEQIFKYRGDDHPTNNDVAQIQTYINTADELETAATVTP